jgi:type IV pilus assembly protein PilN
VDLVRNLEHSRRFLLPRITGENSASDTTERPGQRLEPVSASDRVDFDVLADYNPATAEERKDNRKAAAKGRAAEAIPTPHPLITRPLNSRPLNAQPLPRPGQGRPPYPTPMPVPPLNRGPSSPNIPAPTRNRNPMLPKPNPANPGVPQ